MTNAELIAELATRHDITKAKTKRIIKDLVGIIRGEVQATGRFSLADLGVFTLRTRKATVVKNFGRAIPVPVHQVVHFKTGNGWKRAVNLK